MRTNALAPTGASEPVILPHPAASAIVASGMPSNTNVGTRTARLPLLSSPSSPSTTDSDLAVAADISAALPQTNLLSGRGSSLSGRLATQVPSRRYGSGAMTSEMADAAGSVGADGRVVATVCGAAAVPSTTPRCR